MNDNKNNNNNNNIIVILCHTLKNILSATGARALLELRMKEGLYFSYYNYVFFVVVSYEDWCQLHQILQHKHDK